MPKKAAKCRQTRPKERELYTPAPVRGRVLARHIAGASNRQIAAEEGIDRETVGRILSQREVVRLFAQYQARLLAIVPKAIAAYEAALESDDERIRLRAATKLLEGLQVFHRGGVEQAAEVAGRAAPEVDHRMRKRLVLGEFMEVALEKMQRYSLPVPPEFAAMEAEADKRAEED